MPEDAPATAAAGTYLGFDFGLRRIGVAAGQTATHTASPVTVVRHGEAPDWAVIDRLMREWRPRAAVVGLPLNAEGEETDMSRAARAFGAEIERRYGCPVKYADERLTSRAAEARFAELRADGTARRKDAAHLDALAATIILQNWLESQRDR